MAAIRRFCDGWNQRCRPFTWTKDADQILAKLKRQIPQRWATRVLCQPAHYHLGAPSTGLSTLTDNRCRCDEVVTAITRWR
jgi:hypothetical protein